MTDPFDPTEYELVDGGGLPRVYEGGYIATNEWGRENVIYSQKNDVTWSEDKKQVSFTSVAGRGQDAELGEGERGTDGSFYIVQWRVKALTGGTLQPNGNRTFTNSASYTIDGDSSGSTTGSSTRYSGGGTVVGRNYGKIQVTKELAGDTTLTPTFTVNYTAYDSSDAALPGQSGSFEITADNTWTSPEFLKGTRITIDEVKPTDPSNVDWTDPVFVDADGNPVTELTFSAANGNLGKVTQLRLQNNATLQKATFSASKAVENPDDIDLGDAPTFDLNYTYPADAEKGFPAGSGTLTLPADGTVVTSDELPVGAVLTLSENPNTIPGTTWADPTITPSTITIGDGENPTVKVENAITQDLGSFSVAKDVSGDGAGLVPEGADFTVKYSYTAVNGFPAGSGEITVEAGKAPVVVDKIPAGAIVTLDEVAPETPFDGTWGEPKFDLNSFPITKNTTATVSLDNPITWNSGDFSILKKVEGDGANMVADSTAFTVDYEYTLPSAYVAEGQDAKGTGTLTVSNDGKAVTSSPLPFGTQVTLTERAPSDIAGRTWADPEYSNRTFTIGDETTLAVTLTNTITRDLGSITLNKTISGTGAHLVDPATTFTVDYTYPEGQGFDAGSGQVEVPADGSSVTIDALPADAVVTFTEAEPATVVGGTWGAPRFTVGDTAGNVVTVVDGEDLALHLDNPIDLNSGQLSITKSIEGSGKDLVDPDSSFVVAYSYPAGDGFEAGAGFLDVNADGTATTSGLLPYGAEVALTEQAPAAVEGATWTGATFSPAALTIGDETVVDVVLTNTIEKDQPPTPTPTPTPTAGPTQTSGPAPSPSGSPSATGGGSSASVHTGGEASSSLPWIVGAALILVGGATAVLAIRRATRR